MAVLKSPDRRLADDTRASDAQMQVNVIFTEVDSTLAALQRAAALAENLNGRIRLIVPATVPYPLPLQAPPVALSHYRRRFSVLARTTSVETTVDICYGRDAQDILASILRPHSLVIVGGRHRWWPTSVERRAARLKQAGHEVILVEIGGRRA